MKTNSLLLLLGVSLFAGLNWQVPFLRFTNHWANDGFAVFAAALSVLLLGGLLGRLPKGLARWASWPFTGALVVLAVPCVAIMTFKGIFLALEFASPRPANGQDGGFEKMAQVGEDVAVYRTNGGATTDYGIVVRQEQPILPGVLLVRNVFARYHLAGVSCQLTGPHLTVRHPSSGQVLQEVTLKQFLYF